MKRIFFFATPADVAPLLSRFEHNAPMKFVQTGMFATADRPIYLTVKELPAPGISTDETGSFSTTYLISHRNIKNNVYTFTDDIGQQQWLLSNGDNDQTVQLTMAGLWRTGTLLPGSMTTLHRTPVAQQLMRWFLDALKVEGFKKVEAWWLGHEALYMLKDGRRLTTTAEQSPPEFDLKWSQVAQA